MTPTRPSHPAPRRAELLSPKNLRIFHTFRYSPLISFEIQAQPKHYFRGAYATRTRRILHRLGGLICHVPFGGTAAKLSRPPVTPKSVWYGNRITSCCRHRQQPANPTAQALHRAARRPPPVLAFGRSVNNSICPRAATALKGVETPLNCAWCASTSNPVQTPNRPIEKSPAMQNFIS